MKSYTIIILVLVLGLSLLISCQGEVVSTANKSQENKSFEAFTSEEKLTTETKEVTSAKTQEKTQEYTQEESLTQEKTQEVSNPDIKIHPNVKMSVLKSSFKLDEAIEVSLKDEAKLGFFYCPDDFSLWTVDENGKYVAVPRSDHGVPDMWIEVLADPGESSGYAYLKAFSGLESGKSYILRLDITDRFNACAEVEITIE